MDERRGTKLGKLGWLLAGTLVLAGGLGTLSCKGGNHGEVMELGQEDCVVCHYSDYEATTAPPHIEIFSTACADCHTNVAWEPAVAISHDWFPLRFRHMEIACTDCHTPPDGFRAGSTPNTCVGCHQTDYDAATMPPHAGYPTDCAQCHDEAAWSPSTFAHSWPLDGAHAATPCQSCHLGTPPLYMGTPRDCVGCHRADYDSSPYPGHASFPTTCNDCHTTSAWVPAIEGLAHPNDRFPLNDKHAGIECLQCHNPELGSSTAGMNADCVGCHTGEHSRARMDAKHREERDYPTGAAAPNFCLMCHPNGRN